MITSTGTDAVYQKFKLHINKVMRPQCGSIPDSIISCRAACCISLALRFQLMSYLRTSAFDNKRQIALNAWI